MSIVSIVIELTACIVATLITLYLLDVRYERNDRFNNIKLICWTILFVVISYYRFGGDLFSSILGMVLYFFYAILYYKGKVWKKIIFIIILNAITIFISITCLNVVAWISGESTSTLIHYGNSIRNIEVIIMQTICVGLALILGHFFKRRSTIDWRVATIVGITFCLYLLLGIIYIQLIIHNSIPQDTQLYLVITYLLIIATFFIILWFVAMLAKAHQLEMEKKLLSERVKSQEEIIYRSDAAYQRMRVLKHDIARYLNIYQILLREGKYEELKVEIDKLVQENFVVEQLIYTENRMINSIINDKVFLCKKYAIETEIHIHIPATELHADILVLLSNLFDNAIESAKNQSDLNKKICINIKQKQGMLSILITNRIDCSVLEHNPKLYSTKQDLANHGLGLTSIQMIVARYHGKMRIYEEKQCFCVHIMLEIDDYT